MGAVSKGVSKAYAIVNLATALYIYLFFGIYFDAGHHSAFWALAILPGCPLYLAEAIARVRSVFGKVPQRYLVTGLDPLPNGTPQPPTQRYVVTLRDDLPPDAPRPMPGKSGVQPLTVGPDGKIEEGKHGS